MAEIWLEMAVKRQLVSLLIYGTPSIYLGLGFEFGPQRTRDDLGRNRGGFFG